MREASAELWLSGLPPALARHKKILMRLLTEARSDQRLRILVVGCSIGRGVADELSDVDAYLAVTPEHWSGYTDEVPAVVGRLGGVTDLSQKLVEVPGRDPYRLVWVLYEDGLQLELVIAQAPAEVHPRRDWVVLHDPDARVKELQPDRFATVDEVRQWAYEGWSTLMLCAKYLERASFWEALETLHGARTQVWRLWAAARRIADPQFGLTAVLDSVDPSPPPGIEATHAALERSALARAALACADLLNALWPDAMIALTGSPSPVPPAGLAARRRLVELS